MPASKQPISYENHTNWNVLPRNRHRPIPTSKINSWVSAIWGSKRGITRLETATTMPISAMPSSNITCPPCDPCCVPTNATVIRRSIATRSWTIKTPVVIFPYTVSASCLSLSSLTITIVLEKLSAAAISSELCRSNPNSRSRQNQISTDAPICISPTPRAVFPCSLIVVGLSHSPTKNNSSEIPSCENSWKKLSSWKYPFLITPILPISNPAHK